MIVEKFRNMLGERNGSGMMVEKFRNMLGERNGSGKSGFALNREKVNLRLNFYFSCYKMCLKLINYIYNVQL